LGYTGPRNETKGGGPQKRDGWRAAQKWKNEIIRGNGRTGGRPKNRKIKKKTKKEAFRSVIVPDAAKRGREIFAEEATVWHEGPIQQC